jgi:NADH:ubiquinone oxidoreductase subunit 5 (subunit L)/multisubunit Na+/H+ antiporter MnhA subunit
VYGRRSVVLNTASLKRRGGYLYDALCMKLYFDITYEYVFVRPFEMLATWLAVFDLKRVDGVVNGAGALWRRGSDISWRFDILIIDGAVNGTAKAFREMGSRVRNIQVGNVQVYQRLVLAAAVILMVVIVLKGA